LFLRGKVREFFVSVRKGRRTPGGHDFGGKKKGEGEYDPLGNKPGEGKGSLIQIQTTLGGEEGRSRRISRKGTRLGNRRLFSAASCPGGRERPFYWRRLQCSPIGKIFCDRWKKRGEGEANCDALL